MQVKIYLKKILPKIGSENEPKRMKWTEDILKKVPAGLSILDAGAGEGKFKKFCTHLKYTSQDFGQYDGSGDKTGLQTKEWDNSKLDIVSDITNIPVADKSFDVIMCTEVFEHIPDPISAIKEFSRILRPSGSLIITAPFCSLTHFAPYHFYSGFNKYFFETQLKKFGFEIKEITPNGNFFSFLGQEIKRLPYIMDNNGKRKLNFVEKVILFFTLLVLSRLEKSDKNSNEVLCFGYFVLAKKL